MFVATSVVSVVLAAFLTYSAAQKLSHRQHVVASYARVGVPEHRLNLLATILLAGAAGVITGLVWAPLGIAAAAGLVAYFSVAVIAHIRTGDTARLTTPLACCALAAVSLLLRAATM